MTKGSAAKSSDLVSLIMSVASTLGTRAIDIPSRYGFHLLVAAKLGVMDAGAFYIVFGVLTLFAGLGRLGVDRAMTRDIAQAIAKDDPTSARAAIKRGLAMVLAYSLAAALITAAAAPLIAREVFGEPALIVPLWLSAAILIPLCLSAGVAGALAGLHRVGFSQMIYSWAWPAFFISLALW